MTAGPGPDRSLAIVIRLEDLVVGYRPSKRKSARAPFLTAQRGERIGIVGPNGAARRPCCGRSRATCRRWMARSTFGHRVQLGYLAQLRGCGRPGYHGARRPPGDRSRHARRGSRLPGRSCSGATTCSRRSAPVGRRALAAGARAARGSCPRTCYLLDEPTNHLDIVAREAIESFLVETPATMLVVSHDRRFLETVCERLWVVDDGAVAPFDGGYRAGAPRWPMAGRWRARSSRGGALAPGRWQPRPALQPRALPVASRPRRRRRRRGGGRCPALSSPAVDAACPRPGPARATRPGRSSRRMPTGRRRGSTRSSPASGFAEPSRPGAVSRPCSRTSSSCGASPASSRTSTSPSRRPRTRGSRSRSGPRETRGGRGHHSGSPHHPDRADRPDRLREVHGRSWLHELGATVIDADQVARGGDATGAPSWRGSPRPSAIGCELTARSTARRSAASCSPTRRRCASSKRSSIRRSAR